MNSIERVRAAIAREPVDMVPLGLYLVDHDTIEKVIGRPTLVCNNIDVHLAWWEGRRADIVESYKNDSVEFFRKLDCVDLLTFKVPRLIPPKKEKPPKVKKLDENTWEEESGRVWKAYREANEMTIIKEPPGPQHEYTVDDFQIPAEFAPPDESMFEGFDYLCEKLGSERYICGQMRASPMPMFGDFEESMLVYASQPEIVHAANRYHVAQMAALDKHYYRKGISGVLAEEDMAGTNGTFISPAMLREMCFPYLKQRIEHIKQFVDQVCYHCCGRTIEIMDMFVEAGVDCYQSLQTTAGMEIGLLKEKFGDRMSFWGGVPLESLIMGTPDEIRKTVRATMDRGAPGGGFILGPSHSIAYGTKYDNFMAMLDEFVKLRDKY